MTGSDKSNVAQIADGLAAGVRRMILHGLPMVPITIAPGPVPDNLHSTLIRAACTSIVYSKPAKKNTQGLAMKDIAEIERATLTPLATIDLVFIDARRFSLRIEDLGFPMDLIDWPTMAVSPHGEKIVVNRFKGDAVSIDAATLRCLVDEQYATRLRISFATFFEPSIKPNANNTERKFAQLTSRWKKETRRSSLASRIAEHPAYREIVALGKDAIPLILADLEKNGGDWFTALREITGENPVPRQAGGTKLSAMVEAWIAWGKSHGYQW